MLCFTEVYSVFCFFSPIYFPKKVNKAIVTTQDPYTIQTLMYLQFLTYRSTVQNYWVKWPRADHTSKAFTVAWGASPSPCAKTLTESLWNFITGWTNPGQCWESVSWVAAKKRTSDSKKLIRLSYSAADKQQLNSYFFVVWVCLFSPFPKMLFRCDIRIYVF